MTDSEIKNATISDVSIFIEDHDLLTMFVTLDFGYFQQGFGGYNLTRPPYLTYWVKGILDVTDSLYLEHAKKKNIRASIKDGIIRKIGHITRDIWFDPSKL